MITQSTKRKDVFKQTVRWGGSFLACMIGIAPAAEARGIFSPGRNIRVDQDSSRSRFAFRSVFIPPQYARQAETPLPLYWWEQGSDSPIAIAIGAAEGTRNLDGSKTAAYYWHTDPGNAADNFGSFSFQHLRTQEKESVEKQQTADDKRWASARRALPDIADRRQMRKLRKFHNQLLAQAKAQNLVLSELELLNGLDLANQSELAALDSWGYIDRLAQARQLYRDPDEQIRQARTWSYWHPTLNRWAAPGLGNTQASILRDQSRRADAVKRVWLQEKARPSRIAQLDPGTVDHKTHRQKLASPENTWTLRLSEDQPTATGFAKQPLQVTQEPSLEDLVAETQIQPSPEQQADIALAEALAINTSEENQQVEALLFATPAPEQQWLGGDATVAITPAGSELPTQSNIKKPTQTPESVASPTNSNLAFGLEGSLLMASALQQPPVPTDSANLEGQGSGTPKSMEQKLAVPSSVTSIAAGISEQPIDVIAMASLELESQTIAAAPRPPRPQDPLSLSTLNLSPEQPSTPSPPSQSARSSRSELIRVIEPKPAKSQPVTSQPIRPQQVESAPSPEASAIANLIPQNNRAPKAVSAITAETAAAPSSESANTALTASPAAPPIAATSLTTSVVPSVVATASKPPAPTISAQAQRLVKPAAEAAIQGTDQLLQQHIDTAAELRRQAKLEAAAKQEAEAERQTWIQQEQSMVSQPPVAEIGAPLNLAMEATSTYLEAAATSPIPPVQLTDIQLPITAPSSETVPTSQPLSSSGQTVPVAPSPEGDAAVQAEDVAESIIFFEGIAEQAITD